VAILVVVLLCAGGFGAWLALRAGEWLSSFAAAPSWRGLVHGGTNWVLFCWFADWSWRAASPPFLESDKLGLDARIYLRGAQAWLSGGDPWNATVQFHDALHGAQLRLRKADRIPGVFAHQVPAPV